MSAWKHCVPYDFEHCADTDLIISGSNPEYRIALSGEGQKSVEQLLAKCVSHLDQYPVESFEQFLRRSIADVREATTSPTDAAGASLACCR